MTEIIFPLEMGFSEFTVQLLAEVFEAVAESKLEQEVRKAEITSLAGMTLQDYASQIISDRQVEAELVRLFPDPQSKKPHAIYNGAPYQPKKPGKDEVPSIYNALDIELGDKDIHVSAHGKLTLSPAGVERTRAAARQRLAQNQLAALRQLLAQGIPSVVVDSGHVNVKLIFQLMRVQDAAESEMAKHLAEPLKPLGSLGQASMPDTLKDVRLIVHPTNDRAPQTSNTHVNIYGEVEINFKTVT